MLRILHMAFRICCKICFVLCVSVSSLFLLVFLFFFAKHVIVYIYCNDKEALQKYVQEVNLAESARQEMLLIKKYGLKRLEPAGRREDGTCVSYGVDGGKYGWSLSLDCEDNDTVVGDEERNQHKMWKEKLKSVSRYSAWEATPYHVDYDHINEGVVGIPLYGKWGHHSRLYICFNEDLSPATSPPLGEETLIKIDDGVYWRYSFWPFMRG